MKRRFRMFVLIQFVLGILGLIGYVMCIVKLCNCDFRESYKAEVIYGVGVCTGLGAVIGWIDIEDGPSTRIDPVK